MKTVVLLPLILLAGCGSVQEWALSAARDVVRTEVVPFVERRVTEKLETVAPELVARLDTNEDKLLQLEELKGIDLQDPRVLGLLLTALLSVFGVAKATLADNRKEVERLRTETDELYDKTIGRAP